MASRDVCQVSDMLACGNEHLKHQNTLLISVGDDCWKRGAADVRGEILSMPSSGVQGVFPLVRCANTADTSVGCLATVFCLGRGAA